VTNRKSEQLPDLSVASEADIPAVVSLVNLAFRGGAGQSGWSTEEHYIDGTRITNDLLREDMLAKPEATLLLWRLADGSLNGCVWLEPKENDIWYLGMLAVPPREQNAGLGRRILEAAENWVRERGAREIQMTVVHVRTALIDWYKRRGYTLTGETKPFPYGDDRFGTPKRDDLYFVVLRKELRA
jgi:GNAT superfamily N-acetyltransferase